MKKTIVIVLLVNTLASVAHAQDSPPEGLNLPPYAFEDLNNRDWPAYLSVSTNVDGMVLKLEFADVSVVAGERLKGRMVVSNAGPQVTTCLGYTRGTGNGSMDTAIGQFVVMDDEWNVLPKTFWLPPAPYEMGGVLAQLAPGGSIAFPGDLVKKYSLTNPGIYLVKAVARVPRPATSETKDTVEEMEMVVETPIVLVTVVGRPEGMPPPEPLHTAREIERTPTYSPPQLQVTHPKPDAVPRVPRARDRNSHAVELPPRVDAAVANVDPLAPISVAPTPAPRRVLYYGVPLFVGGLGLLIIGAILWRSRRRQHP